MVISVTKHILCAEVSIPAAKVHSLIHAYMYMYVHNMLMGLSVYASANTAHSYHNLNDISQNTL